LTLHCKTLLFSKLLQSGLRSRQPVRESRPLRFCWMHVRPKGFGHHNLRLENPFSQTTPGAQLVHKAGTGVVAMSRRNKACPARCRVGRVSLFFHHGTWWLYYRSQGRQIRRKAASIRSEAEQVAAQVNAQLATGAPASVGWRRAVCFACEPAKRRLPSGPCRTHRSDPALRAE
jgi:hypothetical protein